MLAVHCRPRSSTNGPCGALSTFCHDQLQSSLDNVPTLLRGFSENPESVWNTTSNNLAVGGGRRKGFWRDFGVILSFLDDAWESTRSKRKETLLPAHVEWWPPIRTAYKKSRREKFFLLSSWHRDQFSASYSQAPVCGSYRSS